VDRLSRSFALTKVAELEKVEVSDEEVEERVQSLLAESDQAPDEQTITDEMKGSIRRILLSEKTLDQLTTIVRGDGGPETDEGEPEPKEATQTETEEHTETEEEGAADDREA
jgi:FKBP-type peptidyl-prolyl cis-trans isomerase (trigger factor)